MGPFEIKNGKVWVALFTCSVTRGIHLETVEDLLAEAFLDALKRFVATKGVPKRIISDNGSNFVRAARALQSLWGNLRNADVQEFMSVNKFSWSFNAPRAAWWGGQFERLIRIVKDCMRKTINGAKLPLMRFVTVIKEIEAIINSRPLTVIPDDVSLPEALTLAHFINSQATLCLPPGPDETTGETTDRTIRLWRLRETLLNDFWERWRDKYFLFLRSAHRVGRSGQSSLAIGDVVYSGCFL